MAEARNDVNGGKERLVDGSSGHNGSNISDSITTWQSMARDGCDLLHLPEIGTIYSNLAEKRD